MCKAFVKWFSFTTQKNIKFLVFNQNLKASEEKKKTQTECLTINIKIKKLNDLHVFF